MSKELTQEYVRKRFIYFPETGVLIRFPTDNKAWNTRYANKPVTYKSRGYIQTRVDNKLYLAHKIIWLYMTGECPNIIDHIDGNPSNNRWSNLRSVSQQENSKNCSLSKNNSSGYHGVHFNKKDKIWEAFIYVDYKKKHLGRFKKKEDAIDARKKAEVKYGFHENHGRN